MELFVLSLIMLLLSLGSIGYGVILLKTQEKIVGLELQQIASVLGKYPICGSLIGFFAQFYKPFSKIYYTKKGIRFVALSSIISGGIFAAASMIGLLTALLVEKP